MSKYLVILCSVLVLAGCTGNSVNPADVPGADGVANTTDGSDWTTGGTDTDDTGIDIVTDNDDNADDNNTGNTRRSGDDEDTTIPIGIKSGVEDVSTGLLSSVEMEIWARGGSGEYSWSHSGLPEGLEFAEQVGKKIKIKGYASKIGEFPVVVKVCDVADTEKCAEKSFKLTVLDNRRNTSIASFTPTENPCGNTDTLKITIVDSDVTGEIAPNALNRIDLEKNISIRFKVEGGRPPYIWSYLSRTKKYWQAAHGIDLPDTFVETPNNDTYDFSGAFFYSLPYCGESITDGSLLYMNRACEEDWSIRDTITVSVHDSCPIPKTAENSYRFKLRTPQESAKDLQMIDFRFSTDHTLSSSYVFISLLGETDPREPTLLDELEENDVIDWGQDYEGMEGMWSFAGSRYNLDQYEGEGVKTLRLPFATYYDIAGVENSPLPDVVSTITGVDEVSKDGMGVDLEVTFQYFVIFSKYRFLVYEPQPMTTFTSNKSISYYLLQKNVKRKELPNPFLHNNSIIFGPFEYVDPSGVPADIATAPAS